MSLIKINPFDEDGLKLIDKHHILICQLFHKSHPEIVKEIADKGATIFSMDALTQNISSTRHGCLKLSK